jgi:hypothetical protein
MNRHSLKKLDSILGPKRISAAKVKERRKVALHSDPHPRIPA